VASLKLVKQRSITPKLLDEIIRIKSAAWPYSLEQQIAWIKNNIKSNDIHVMFRREKEFVAYLNLVEISLNVDGLDYDAYGVGNVCSVESGKRYGVELIGLTNDYLLENSKIGLLFCKDNLVEYYLSVGWKTISREDIDIGFTNSASVSTLIYNFDSDSEIHKVVYQGRIF